jgi:hypothetical protein
MAHILLQVLVHCGSWGTGSNFLDTQQSTPSPHVLTWMQKYSMQWTIVRGGRKYLPHLA